MCRRHARGLRLRFCQPRAWQSHTPYINLIKHFVTIKRQPCPFVQIFDLVTKGYAAA
ncbi:hypothetical protein GCWU000324_02630 [Kingella oralis ATCC 51147]|uniref:Uncharacterized protein n=1 Tax=Kingella oralis ATCC 51147 TaxID=629741 RepID=C4GLQ9_9NEIS|nr:hypothetical protein GCWU000324_02630 [Kingella oralis ATCC 51147]